MLWAHPERRYDRIDRDDYCYATDGPKAKTEAKHKRVGNQKCEREALES